MAAKPTQRKGWELFAHPAQPNQRRYEALRAYLYEGASLDQAAGRFGYTPATLNSLARDLRAGKLALFAPAGKPGRKHAPKKDRALSRVIQLRRDGLSVYEISTRLAVEGIGLNRTGVGQILREEGFGRLLRDPADQASTSPATSGRDTRLPKTSVLDFDAFPQRVHTAWPGCCWPSPTWSPWTCPPWCTAPATPEPTWSLRPAGSCRCWRSSSPAPGACPTSTTCLATRPPACSPALGSCRRRPR